MENRPFLPGRGRSSWGDAPGAGNYGDKWHQKLDYVEQPKNPRTPKELRIVGGVYTLNQHYVRFEKKTGGYTGYYEVCPDFNPITGEFRTGTEAVCPICRDFGDSDLPEEIRMFGSFRYYFDCFDISAIKAGATGGVFGVVWANKYGKNNIAQISDTLEGASVDDLARGCTVFWYQNSKAKDAKERMSFTRGEPLEVKYSPKKNLYGLQYNGRVYTGEPTPFDEIVEVKTADKIVADLKRVKLYDKLESFLGGINRTIPTPSEAPRSASSGNKNEAAPPPRESASSDWGDFGGSEDPVETPPKESAPSTVSGDFDFDDDLPTPSTASTNEKAKDLDSDFFGDEEPSSEDATDTPDAVSAADDDFGDWGGEDAASPVDETPATKKKNSEPPDTSSIADDFGDDW